MNDNEGTIPQQIAHLEAIAGTMREDLKEARAGLLTKPGRREAHEAGGGA